MSFEPRTQTRQCTKLHRTFNIILFVLKSNFNSELCNPIYGSDNFSIHPSFCLMSLMIDYIFKKPLDKCVVIIINILNSSRISIKFMMRNTILALDDLCCHRPLYCVPSNKNLFVFCVIPRVPCYLAFVLLYHGVLPSFMSRRSWGLLHLLRILGRVILLTLTILSWYPCCF